MFWLGITWRFVQPRITLKAFKYTRSQKHCKSRFEARVYWDFENEAAQSVAPNGEAPRFLVLGPPPKVTLIVGDPRSRSCYVRFKRLPERAMRSDTKKEQGFHLSYWGVGVSSFRV